MSLPLLIATLATLISVTGLSRIAVAHHDARNPSTLSELAVAETTILRKFRWILFVCGALFGVAIFIYAPSQEPHAGFLLLFNMLMVGGEFIVAALPAKDKTRMPHQLAAQVMAFGMLGLAVIFLQTVDDHRQLPALLALIVMAMAAILTLVDKRRYLTYELAFIYSSHLSILIALSV